MSNYSFASTHTNATVHLNQIHVAIILFAFIMPIYVYNVERNLVEQTGI